MLRYHRDVHLPTDLVDAALSILVRGQGEYTLTRHAQQRAEEKGVVLPRRIPFFESEVVEVTTDAERRIDKFLVRFPCAVFQEKDVVMSVSKDRRIPTVYLNDRTDAHRTLDRSAYISA